MSDMDKLNALLSEWNVPRTVTENWHEYTQEKDGNMAVCVERHYGNNKVNGYDGFFTKFVFDESGRFICMGAWE